MPPRCILVGVTSKPFKNRRPLTAVIFEPHGPSSHFKRCEERQWLAIPWGFRKSARRRRPRPPAGPMLEVGGASPIPGAAQPPGAPQGPPKSHLVEAKAGQESPKRQYVSWPKREASECHKLPNSLPKPFRPIRFSSNPLYSVRWMHGYILVKDICESIQNLFG